MLRSVARSGERGAVPVGAHRGSALDRRVPLPAPRSLICAALLALLSTACQGDGRTPLVIYSPHGRDLLTLLERRFEQLHPDVDVRWLDMGSHAEYDWLGSERAIRYAARWLGGVVTDVRI